jgi:hypothetical protein
MDLIESSLKVPILYVRDNLTDTGSEPNTTTPNGWESVDVWVRQTADGVTVSEAVLGGAPAVVYVRVNNRGTAAYPSDGNDVVRVYWAKAQAGLSWPAPWNGTIPMQGGVVAAPQTIGAVPLGPGKLIPINWAVTPNPTDYPGKDGHFCLLAVIDKPTSPEFEGFQGPNLNQNVLKLSNVAWRNIHIVPTAKMKLGELVLANHTDIDMLTQLVFEVPDVKTSPVDQVRPGGGRLLVSPRGPALEKLRLLQGDHPFLEEVGEGTFRVLDNARGIPLLDLKPEEVLPFGLEYVPEREVKGYVVRATQISLNGDSSEIVGGQTFVAGEVEGLTTGGERRRKGPLGRWVIALVLLLIVLFSKRRKKK